MLTRAKDLLAVGLIAFATFAEWHDAIEKAQSLAREGHIAEAEALLRHALISSPNSAELHAELGTLLCKKKEYQEAVPELGRAAQIAPESSAYSMRLAEALIGWGHFTVAIEFLLAVKPGFEHLPEYHYDLGLANYNLGNYSDALKEFELTLRLAPSLDLATFFKANTHAAMGDLEEAAGIYYALLTRDPSNADYCLALGKVLDRLGPDHREEAIKWLRRALALRPGNPAVQFSLAVSLDQAGRWLQAMPLLEDVVRKRPREIPPHVVLARVYYRLRERAKGDREAAIVKRLQSEATSSGAP